MKFSLKGLEKMLSDIDKAAAQVQKAAKSAVYMEAQIVLTESKKRCPSATGTLRASGMVEKPVMEGKNIYAEISYGGAASQYALAVHEHLSVHSPPAWQQAEAFGNGVQWHTPGTGPKFLESVINEGKADMRERPARRIQGTLGGKIGF